MNKNSKAPAFPNSLPGEYGGLTKREYVAVQALSGILADSGLQPTNEEEVGHLAARVCQMADALLAELAKEPTK